MRQSGEQVRACKVLMLLHTLFGLQEFGCRSLANTNIRARDGILEI
jgi:hypothetical protein